MNTELPNIFDYSLPHEFLKDAWYRKKKKNPSFSLRAWARRLGFENNSPLSLMLAGKRPIPKKYIPQFSENLKLSAKQTLYLETLIDLTRAKNTKQREFYQDRLKQLASQSNLKRFEFASFKFLSEPIHTILLEMTELKDFQEITKWIQSRLIFKVSAELIESALERLKEFGLLERDTRGKLRKTHVFLCSPPDVQSQGAYEYHKQTSLYSAEFGLISPSEKREFNSFSMSIRPDVLPKAKEMIRQFVDHFVSEVSGSSGEAEQIYQFNVQFFPLTQSQNETDFAHSQEALN